MDCEEMIFLDDELRRAASLLQEMKPADLKQIGPLGKRIEKVITIIGQTTEPLGKAMYGSEENERKKQVLEENLALLLKGQSHLLSLKSCLENLKANFWEKNMQVEMLRACRKLDEVPRRVRKS